MNKKKIEWNVYFLLSVSEDFLVILFFCIHSLIILNYKYKVLNNQWIKLIQENHNLNRNCIMPTEPVNRFSTGWPIYLI